MSKSIAASARSGFMTLELRQYLEALIGVGVFVSMLGTILGFVVWKLSSAGSVALAISISAGAAPGMGLGLWASIGNFLGAYGRRFTPSTARILRNRGLWIVALGSVWTIASSAALVFIP